MREQLQSRANVQLNALIKQSKVITELLESKLLLCNHDKMSWYPSISSQIVIQSAAPAISSTPTIQPTMVIQPQINSTSPEEINAGEYTKHLKEFFNWDDKSDEPVTCFELDFMATIWKKENDVVDLQELKKHCICEREKTLPRKIFTQYSSPHITKNIHKLALVFHKKKIAQPDISSAIIFSYKSENIFLTFID